MVVAGLAVWLALVISNDVRDSIAGSLFYAWIPVSVWLIALTFTVRHRRRSLPEGWRYWLLAGGAVVIIVGTFSVIRPGTGIAFDDPRLV